MKTYRINVDRASDLEMLRPDRDNPDCIIKIKFWPQSVLFKSFKCALELGETYEEIILAENKYSGCYIFAIWSEELAGDWMKVATMYIPKAISNLPEKERDKVIQSFIEDWNRWSRGELYEYSVIESEQCNLGHTHEKIVHCCTGFHSEDEARKEGEEDLLEANELGSEVSG